MRDDINDSLMPVFVILAGVIIFIAGMFAGHGWPMSKEVVNKVVWDRCQESVVTNDRGTTQMINCFKELPKQPIPK